MVMIGTDSHKRTHTVVALDGLGRRLAEKTVATTSDGHFELLRWAGQWPQVEFALEDCRHLTRRLEQDLLSAGQRVVRVPTRLMATARRTGRQPGKSDPIDAEAVALAALREPGLPVAELDGPAREVKLLSDHRRVLVAERVVQYVRGNFWAGESFADLPEAQARVVAWCTERAGMRVHGTTAARPVLEFVAVEKPCLLAVAPPYDIPVFTRVKVHRDFHVEVARSLYSAPEHLLGQYLHPRADSELVKLFHGGALVKTHPRQLPGRRCTDRADLPAEKSLYAMRDLQALVRACAGHGDCIGVYAERLLDDPLPWTRMRAVYRLLGLVRRHGAGPVEAACSRALDLDVVSVSKIASMLDRATENDTTALPAAAGSPSGRFAREPGEFAVRGGTQLTLIRGGAAEPESTR